jgi:hypothetical protein
LLGPLGKSHEPCLALGRGDRGGGDQHAGKGGIIERERHAVIIATVSGNPKPGPGSGRKPKTLAQRYQRVCEGFGNLKRTAR